MSLESSFWSEIVALRHTLHKNPELSGQEFDTVQRVRDFCKQYNPSEMIGLGETGLAVIYDSGNVGSTTMIRGDMDALPIQEVNEMAYTSIHEGVSHKCGHDGHTASLCALAKKLSEAPIQSGRVVLLFQPAEENGEGAQSILADPNFGKVQPDRVFAYHNLPGYPMHQVVYKKGVFTAAARSMLISLKGKTAHAAEPEMGINPAQAIVRILQLQHPLSCTDIDNEGFFLITPVFATLGDKAYGISAGYGEVHFTLRSFSNAVMDANIHRIQTEVQQIADEENIKVSIDWTESFDANENDPNLIEDLEKVVHQQRIDATVRETPFKWGEDFGLFTRKYPGYMFGIGSGENCPALHNPDYDFPDEILETALAVFEGLVRKYHGNK